MKAKKKVKCKLTGLVGIVLHEYYVSRFDDKQMKKVWTILHVRVKWDADDKTSDCNPENISYI